MIDSATLKAKFGQALDFPGILESAAAHSNDATWRERHSRLQLSAAQRSLIEGFSRDMNVLAMTGPWCGDCALQGAAMQRIAEANPARIHLRFLDRNEHADLQVRVRINAGMRVPVTFFLAEDFEPVSRFGDRTLSRYRSMARKALGDAAPVLAQPPDDPVREVLDETLAEFERVQLLLTLSTRL